MYHRMVIQDVVVLKLKRPSVELQMIAFGWRARTKDVARTTQGKRERRKGNLKSSYLGHSWILLL